MTLWFFSHSKCVQRHQAGELLDGLQGEVASEVIDCLLLMLRLYFFIVSLSSVYNMRADRLTATADLGVQMEPE